jgi:hypothetical protein
MPAADRGAAGPAQEGLQHGRCRIKIRYHAIAERVDDVDVLGVLPGQDVRGIADRGEFARRPVDRDRRRLIEHNPAPRDVDERVDRALVDRYPCPQPHGTCPLPENAPCAFQVWFLPS